MIFFTNDRYVYKTTPTCTNRGLTFQSTARVTVYLATTALAFRRLIGHVAVRLSDRKCQHALHQVVETVILALVFLLRTHARPSVGMVVQQC